LILSPDSFGAALIGAATELAGFRAAYPADEESPTDAIRRIKPWVVLVDVAHASARDLASLGPAMMTGAALVFYGPRESLRDASLLAAKANAVVVALPQDLEDLPALLTEIAARKPGRTRSE
jgi:hypothetical protein